MWTPLTRIGSLMRNLVRSWQSRRPGLARRGDQRDDATLLLRRMSTINIDSDTFARLEPALFGNLQTMCRECEHPALCRHDLHDDPAGATWEDYCPNAVVLNAVAELRWFRAAAGRRARR